MFQDATSSIDITRVAAYVLNSIDAYRQEIQMQPQYLKKPVLPDCVLGASMQENTIFAGSGDSLAAAMLAEYFSGGRVRAMDPLDVMSCISSSLTSSITGQSDCGHSDRTSAARKRRVYLVSVSGKTRANITVAKNVSDSVAITSDPKSTLARSTGGRVVPLRFPSTGTSTAGSISFLASALTCMSLVRGFSTSGIPFEKILDVARKDASEIDISGSLYILGNSLTYPLAVYGAAKFYEVLGYDARCCRLEQFFHMDLFSACKGDTILLLSPPSLDGSVGICDSANDALCKAGVDLVVPGGFDKCVDGSKSVTAATGCNAATLGFGLPASKWDMTDSLKCILYCTFLLQSLSLKMADEGHMSECHYVSSTHLRRASNDIIYEHF